MYRCVSDWTTVEASQQRHRPTTKPPKTVKIDFATFKTRKCTIGSYHDHKQCDMYHSTSDKRRNPFDEEYFLDSCENNVEKAYHPHSYWTEICPSIASNGICTFGKYCAFAHEVNDLRKRDEIIYPMIATPSRFYDIKPVCLEIPRHISRLKQSHHQH